MSDPINDLENFNSEGLPVNPLAPSEVRRLGDRMRRRRNAAGVVAGVAAVAVIATPLALYAGGDNSSSPSPAPPANTATTGSPDADETTPPSPEPVASLVKEIPEGFPLAAGWPDDDLAESEEQGLTGPHRRLDSLLFQVCGTAFEEPEYVDRLRANWTNPEDYRDRQLTTYADAGAAVDAVSSLTDFYRACPEEELSDGSTRISEVRRTQVGGESWALVQHLELEGAPAISLQIIHVIRLGRAVLIDTAANEGSIGDAGSQIDFMTTATDEPVARMCAFTEAGCANGTETIPPPRIGTVGPEGYGSITLGMTWEEGLATGEVAVARGAGTESCRSFRFLPETSTTEDDLVVSDRLGVAGIFFKGLMRTPEGIGLGSTATELLAAHPDADMAYNGTYTIPVPGYPDRQYYAALERDDRVAEMTLELIEQDCYR
jgi:hypothetical protein